jgi:predicted ATPase/class 3 adenylate cyclase
MDPPSGTVTFLFTDIEGSTWHVQRLGDEWDDVLLRHYRILREIWQRHDGYEVSTEGDAFFVAFTHADEAVAAAIDAHRVLENAVWPHATKIAVRIGLHTGEARVYDGDYVGLAVHQAARVQSAAHGGQVLISEQTRELVTDSADISFVDLGIQRLKDIADPMRLYQVVAAGLRTDFPPPRTLTAMPNNFPLQMTEFVGRLDDIEGVRSELGSGRLITLTGAGGVGKTRLALEVCSGVLHEFSGGAWLVDLASVSDPTLIGTVAASALGVREQPPRPVIETLVDYLIPRRTLILLDNCEHLIDSCAEFTERLLTRCPEIKIVATSREALNVPGERCWRLRSLVVPTIGASPGEIADSESVRLFGQRIREADPTFAIDADNAETVAHICRRLDGVALALELAASRARTMALQEIADRLDDRFRLLTGGSRTALPRQRTLEATVAWSYELLSSAEQLLLSRLSVFAGGFTVATAQEVCSDGGLTSGDVLELVPQLAERSMIVLEPTGAGETRYRLLETIRQFARDRLIDSGEAAAIRDRLLSWSVQLAETATTGPNQRVELTAEEDNLRAALAWALETGDEVAALRIAGSVWFGQFDERARLYAQILPPSSDVPPDVAAKALFGGLGLAFMTADWARGVELAVAGAAAAETAGDDVRLVLCLTYHGCCLQGLGELERGLELAERARELAESVGYAEGEARSLMALTWMWAEVDLDRAEEVGSRGIQRAAGLDAFEVGHLEEALAFVQCLRGDYAGAAARLSRTAVIFKGIQRNCGAHALETCAAWAAMTRRFELGAELLGAAQRLRDETGDRPRPWERRVREDWLPLIDDALATAAAITAVDRGRTREFEDALDFASTELRRYASIEDKTLVRSGETNRVDLPNVQTDAASSSNPGEG